MSINFSLTSNTTSSSSSRTPADTVQEMPRSVLQIINASLSGTTLPDPEANGFRTLFSITPQENVHSIQILVNTNEYVTLDQIRQCNKNFTSDNSFKLNVSKSSITDQELKEIVERFPNITEITANDCPLLTGAALAHLSSLVNLQALYIFVNHNIKDADLIHLASLTKITSLTLKACSKITGAGFADLAPLTKLKVLDLSWCMDITRKNLGFLTLFPNLVDLRLFKCFQFEDADLVILAPLTNLKALDISSCFLIKGPGLVHLASLTNLQSLNLRNCSIKKSNLVHLASLTNLKITI